MSVLVREAQTHSDEMLISTTATVREGTYNGFVNLQTSPNEYEPNCRTTQNRFVDLSVCSEIILISQR